MGILLSYSAILPENVITEKEIEKFTDLRRQISKISVNRKKELPSGFDLLTFVTAIMCPDHYTNQQSTFALFKNSPCIQLIH